MAMLCVYGGECSGCMFCQNFDDDPDDLPFSDLPDDEEGPEEYYDED